MLVVPQWDFDFPGRDKLKDGYKALTARPFLPRYFPGFDLYFWIDADCWVQQGDAIALFLAAARTGALAVAPEIHRSMRHYRHAWGEFSAVNGAAYEAVLRQGDGRAADPLSPDQCRRVRARRPTRRTGRAGPRCWARPCSARPT